MYSILGFLVPVPAIRELATATLDIANGDMPDGWSDVIGRRRKSCNCRRRNLGTATSATFWTCSGSLMVPPKASDNGGGHNVHSTTINCMHKLACYTSMADRSPSWKCACLLGLPVDAVDQTLCADWIACLQDQSQAEAFVAEAIEALYRLRSPFTAAPLESASPTNQRTPRHCGE